MIHSSRSRALLAIVAAGVEFGTPSFADAPPTEAAKEGAKVLYQKGRREQDARDFPAAVRDYSAAYELTHNAGVLFYRGQCYQAKAEKDKAVDDYKAFLAFAANAKAPDEGLRLRADEASRALAGLEPEVTAEKARAAKAKADEEERAKAAANEEAARKGVEAEAAKRAAAAAVSGNGNGSGNERAAIQLTAPAIAPAAEAPPQKAPVYKKWWLWTTVGAVVVAGAGVGLGIGLAPPAAPPFDRQAATIPVSF